MITNKDLSIDSKNGKVTLNGNKYDLGTQGEIDAAVKDVYSVMGEMGAKNLIHFPYDYGNRPSLAGITYTINADNSITMTGTTTSRSNYWLYDHGQGFMNLKGGNYILSKTGRTDVSHIVAFYKGSTWVKQVSASVNDIPVSIDVNTEEYDNIGIAISFSMAGISVNNFTTYPMLRLAEDTDSTYHPYAMTNKQLTEVIGDLSQTGLTGDSVAEQILDLNSTLGYKNSITLGSGSPIISFTKSGDVVGFYATLTNLEEGVITIGTLPERFLPLFKYNIYPLFSINSPYESQDASLWIDDLGVVKLYKASGITSGYLSGTYLAKNRGNA